MNATIPILNAETAAVQRALAAHGQQAGALLPVLHAVQDALGYIPAAAVGQIAQALNRSRAEVHGVITFYHHFRQQPAGKQQLHICQAEACRAQGAATLMAQAEHATGCAAGQTRADGVVTLEAVYCLGLCATAPAMQVGERLFGRMNPAKLDKLLSNIELTQGATA